MAEVGGEPGEDEHARVDRELIELLNELKIALPAVQVLFAFFFVLPFYARFATITSLQKAVYFGAFLVQGPNVRCATRGLDRPAVRDNLVGFRPVRTYP